ncbi:hypothetical protein EVAR_89784_1 [Eumeta japonica]|uniref:Uncharacterized protein n=1 Tax=Eumeta variegata TaxID=151549 RepID=A0A4C1XCG7_EUMVA|nr:hypothetical protein EVAR_89784_1 [Eumeta japonica]
MLNTRMENGRVWPASTVDMHRVRCAIELRWERPSPGVPTVRPPSACVSTRQHSRRRDRTRQTVTTPQLVTPLESNSEMSLTPLVTLSLSGSGTRK